MKRGEKLPNGEGHTVLLGSTLFSGIEQTDVFDIKLIHPSNGRMQVFLKRASESRHTGPRFWMS